MCADTDPCRCAIGGNTPGSVSRGGVCALNLSTSSTCPDHTAAVLYFSEDCRHDQQRNDTYAHFRFAGVRRCDFQGIVAEEPSVPASVSKSSSRSMPSRYRVSGFPSPAPSLVDRSSAGELSLPMEDSLSSLGNVSILTVPTW